MRGPITSAWTDLLSKKPRSTLLRQNVFCFLRDADGKRQTNTCCPMWVKRQRSQGVSAGCKSVGRFPPWSSGRRSSSSGERKKTERSAGVVRIATASFYFHAPLCVGAAASGVAGLRQVSCTCVYSEEHKVEMRTSCKIMKCFERFAQRCENYLTGGATMGVNVNWKWT